MVYNKVRIFLSEDALVELEDHFSDKEDSDALRKFIFGEIRTLARSAKLCKINKTFSANIQQEDGEVKPEPFYIKDVNLEKFSVKENPDWLPEKMDRDEIKIYEMKIGTKAWEHLLMYSQIYCARLKFYNDSIPENDKFRKSKIAEMPKCFEQIMHEQLLQPVMNKISQSINTELDKEFEEVYTEKKKEKTKKKKK